MRDYIVFDLEWNQSPDGKDGSVERFPFEIIEIGAVKLDQDFREISEFHKLVRPRVYQEIHQKISEVTHMDMEELREQGEEFPEAARAFLDWCGGSVTFCTWGAMDLTEFQRNMAYYGMEIPFEKPLYYYDVQKLYCLLYGDGKVKQSLDVAVKEMGICEDRPFHRALDDAYYTGLLMRHMDFEQIREYYSLDYYRLPSDRSEEIYHVFPSYSKYVSSPFETKEEAIADKTVSDMLCYRCGRMLRKKIRWFPYNQKLYLGLAWCPVHGFVKGKIRVKKGDEGRVYVVKTLKIVDEEDAALVYEKQEESRKKRNEKNKMRRQHKKLVE